MVADHRNQPTEGESLRTPNRSAAGGSGLPARWTSSAKPGIGTARSNKRHVWRCNHKICSMPAGKLLRIATMAPAVIQWSADDWNTVPDITAHAAGLGIPLADLSAKALLEGTQVTCTFCWPEADRWEGADCIVPVGSLRGDAPDPAEKSETDEA